MFTITIDNPQFTDDLVKGYPFYENLKNNLLQQGDTLAAVQDMCMVAIAQYDPVFLLKASKPELRCLQCLTG